MSKMRHCYVGRKTCGCIVYVTVDDPNRTAQTGKDVAEAIKLGLTVERMTIDDFKAGRFGCKCNRQAPLFSEVIL